MNMPNAKELNRIYDALSDQTSKKIYRHRLLYSLLGEKEEITRMIYESSPASALLSASKVCYYGAGAGSGWLVRYNRNASFVIDKYKTGTLCGLPIISLEDFLKLPDCKEYLIIVTVGKEKLRREIAEELDGCGLRYTFAYLDLQYFELQYFDHPHMRLRNEYFADVGALDGETTKYFLEHFENGQASCGHLYLIRIPGISEEIRNHMINELAGQGVASNVHYKPLPMMTAYKKMGFDIKDYPNAFRQYENEITLPLHTRLENEDVEYVVRMVTKVLRECENMSYAV